MGIISALCGSFTWNFAGPQGENLLKTDKIALEYSDKNEFTHLYTMHVKPDGTYEVQATPLALSSRSAMTTQAKA
eukprot:scaffold321166_cov37-Tisochrysis_lutea.AAC.2